MAYVDPYAPAQKPGQGGGGNSQQQPTNVNETGTGSSSQSGSSNTNTGGTSNTNTSQSGTSSNIGRSRTGTNQTTTIDQTTTQFDPVAQAALNALIAQLQGGGTANQQADRAARSQEVGNLQGQREGYSKQAAFADAKGLMAQQMRLALEKLMPSINSAALGAGASGSSMRALLVQRAAENAAQNAEAAGLGAAVQYGGVAGSLSNTLASLLNHDDPATQALVQALSVAKGGTTRQTGTNTTTGNSTTDSTNFGTTSNQGTSETVNKGFSNTNTQQQGNTATNSNKNIGYGGGSGSSGGGSSGGGGSNSSGGGGSMTFSGPTETIDQFLARGGIPGDNAPDFRFM